MIFARKVWKLLVALKDGMALAFLLLFFLALYAVLTARPSAGVVRDGALLLRLDGQIVEEPAIVDPIDRLLSTQAPVGEYRTRDLVRALRTAATDDRVKAVVFDLSLFTGGGMVTMQEVGAAIDQVRAAKKPVLTYALAYSDDAMVIAAHSSEAWVHPMGGAFVLGPGGNNLYFGQLLEKLKVNAHVYRVGTFKSAVEPFLRNDQSPEAREASEAVYAAAWEAWKRDVAKARPKAQIDRVTQDPVAWLASAKGDPAAAAKDAGLVDRIGDEAQFGARVAELVGADEFDDRPGAFVHTGLDTWLAANQPTGSGRRIGVVTVAGEIVDGDAGPGTAGGDRIAELLDDALDDDLAALVVRVDSPGGSVLASERIRAAILRHKAKGIPIVVSMVNLAASGGYWVSTPAQRIFAEPATLTGSIGVFAVVPTFERTLADLGVSSDGVKTTPLSGQPDLAGGFNPAIDAMIQANVENIYARFLTIVGKSRGKTATAVDQVAQGRVWAGGDARQLGLVDQFGGLDDALAWAAKTAKLDDGEWQPVYYGDIASPYAGLMETLLGQREAQSQPVADLAGMAVAGQERQLRQLFADASRLLRGRGIRAYCLECAGFTSPQQAGGEDAVSLAARWLGLTAK